MPERAPIELEGEQDALRNDENESEPVFQPPEKQGSFEFKSLIKSNPHPSVTLSGSSNDSGIALQKTQEGAKLLSTVPGVSQGGLKQQPTGYEPLGVIILC
jgi:hypothetical protein